MVPKRLVPINLLFDLFSNAPLWSLFDICVRINEFVSKRIFGVVSLHIKNATPKGGAFFANGSILEVMFALRASEGEGGVFICFVRKNAFT